MSQYGAYAMAKLGYTYEEILTFYYTGITVGELLENY
jgi:stage II sporulation protein D